MTKETPLANLRSCADFFDAIAARYDRVYALDRDSTRRRLTRVLVELPPAARVLDLGVGTGRELSMLLDAGHQITGIDLSSAMLARCARRSRPVKLVATDLWRPLPFAAHAFDVAIALHGTLAHPPPDLEPMNALVTLARELARLVGVAVVAEVAAPGFLEAIDAGAFPFARRTGADRFVHRDDATNNAIEGHVVSAGAWKEVFAMAGFAHVTVEPITPLENLVAARVCTAL
jgi:SAM-dependent methyltransferase